LFISVRAHSQVAVDYVWRKMASCFLSPGALVAAERFEALTKAAAHRPTGPDQGAIQRYNKRARSPLCYRLRPHVVTRCDSYSSFFFFHSKCFQTVCTLMSLFYL